VEPSACQLDILPPPTLSIDPLPLVSRKPPCEQDLSFFLISISFFLLLLLAACLGEASSTVILKATGRSPWKLAFSHKVCSSALQALACLLAFSIISRFFKVSDSKGALILEEKETVGFTTPTHSLRLIPRVSGLHEYTFHALDDSLYKTVPLQHVHHNFTIFEYDQIRIPFSDPIVIPGFFSFQKT